MCRVYLKDPFICGPSPNPPTGEGEGGAGASSSWTVQCGVERTAQTNTRSLEPQIRGADSSKIHVFGVCEGGEGTRTAKLPKNAVVIFGSDSARGYKPKMDPVNLWIPSRLGIKLYEILPA